MKQFYKQITPFHLFFIVLLFVGSFLRLYNLNWDQGFYLHPDERLYTNASNISMPKSVAEFFSAASPLNPKMFYYGAFPLYLYTSIWTLFSPEISFTLVSRFISAVFSIATIPLVYILGKKLLSHAIGIIASVLFTFSVGSIQYAHFNTTESMLLFFLTAITVLSFQAVKKLTSKRFIKIGILIGLAYATKIIALSFFFLPFLTLLYSFFQTRKLRSSMYFGGILIIVSIIVGCIFSPYQIIDFESFLHEQTFMQGVIQGKSKPPFTIIYEGTIPYLFQILHVFPFIFGFISFPLSLVGLVLLCRKVQLKDNRTITYAFLLLYPLVYFAVAGMWFAKFSRYYAPLIPFFCVWAAYVLDKCTKPIKLLLLLLIIINGMLFMRIYSNENTRIQASTWIYKNIPPTSSIATEHWDDPLPLPSPMQPTLFTTIQLPVYDPDSPEKLSVLLTMVNDSDYIVLSSRRVYHSIQRNPDLYPYTNTFYKLLFSDKLGFNKIKEFHNYPFFFSDDIADESFQSYDHPPVLIFQKNSSFSLPSLKRQIIEQTTY